MAKEKLSARKVKTASPGKYEDGGGLRLVVSKKEAKRWVLRFTIDGKRREMGLGSFPDVGLAEARDKATQFRKQAAKGADPIEARLAEPKKTPTFTTCAARYIRAQRRGWKNAKHARQWISTLKTYARPVIGSKQVDAISTEDILKILPRSGSVFVWIFWSLARTRGGGSAPINPPAGSPRQDWSKFYAIQ